MGRTLEAYLKPIQYGLVGAAISAGFAKLGGRWVTPLTFKEAGTVGAVFGATFGTTLSLWMVILGGNGQQKVDSKALFGAILLAAIIVRFSNRSIRLGSVEEFILTIEELQ